MSATPQWAWRTELFIRSLLGLIVAPIAAGVFVSVMICLLILSGASAVNVGESVWDDFMLVVLAGGSMGADVGVPWSLAAGWPIHLFLLWRRKTHILFYGLAGMLIAIAGVCVLMMTPAENDLYQLGFAGGSAAYIAAGLAGAAVFWLIRRPDRPAPVTPPAKRSAEATHP
jgi:hypothetical protein